MADCWDTACASDAPARIALLTPYAGTNLGDAAIQDAMIDGLRRRLPGAQFSAICLDTDAFVVRHGWSGFPLCATNRPFYGMHSSRSDPRSAGPHLDVPLRSHWYRRSSDAAKTALKRAPRLARAFAALRGAARWARREADHALEGYRFLRGHHLLVVSGGGQLDDEWGGPWGHPFSLLKWGFLARVAGVPFAFASVGVGKISTSTTRRWLAGALRLALYRSYREENTRRVASTLLPRASEDSVVPDLALAVPLRGIEPDASVGTLARGRRVVALSPIMYGKAGYWPVEDANGYERYISELSAVAAGLIRRDYFVVLAWSSLRDRNAVPEIIRQVVASGNRVSEQLFVPRIETWHDLVSVLLSADLVIASRMHSIILSCVARKPTVAISFDPKVDWVMADLGQEDQVFGIHGFAAPQVLDAIGRLAGGPGGVLKQLDAARRDAIASCAAQYDALVRIAQLKAAATLGSVSDS
jgi:polysaccharide pyruvyl transferase WcaK-like protein